MAALITSLLAISIIGGWSAAVEPAEEPEPEAAAAAPLAPRDVGVDGVGGVDGWAACEAIRLLRTSINDSSMGRGNALTFSMDDPK